MLDTVWDLNHLWFVLMGVLLAGYAVLDGFDLGVGMLHLFARSDGDRRILMNSIGPVWDANEVWLIVFGGAMFAAFPHVYATVFSAFYLAFMLLLFALILRAVAMEFRGKLDSPRWRGLFDACFCGASTVAVVLFGVATGNAIRGLKVDATMNYAGSFLDLLGPYPILVGLFAVSLFAMHGAIYLYLKTEGDLQQRVHGWVWRSFLVFAALFVVTSVVSIIAVPSATGNFRHHPWLGVVAILNVAAIANIPRCIQRCRPGQAFFSSCCCIAALVFLFGAALYPNLVVSSLNPAYNLTIYTAASSPRTLAIMAVFVAIGMPFVLAYTAMVYRVFRGKVKLEASGY